MPPAQQPQMYPTAQNNDAVMAAIQSLKADITSEIDTRLQAQQQAFEERLKPVDTISQTLEEARKAQAEAQQRQQQQDPQVYQPKSWEQIRQDAANDAYERMKQEQTQREQQEQRTRELSAQEEAELEGDIDRQLSQLEKNGYLPPVGNPNDFNDPGVATRRELLQYAKYTGSPELIPLADSLAQLHKNNMVFDAQTQSFKDATGTTTPLPGKFAPVGNSSTHGPSGFSGPTQAEIHNMSMDELTQLATVRGYGPVPQTAYNETGF